MFRIGRVALCLPASEEGFGAFFGHIAFQHKAGGVDQVHKEEGI